MSMVLLLIKFFYLILITLQFKVAYQVFDLILITLQFQTFNDIVGYFQYLLVLLLQNTYKLT